MSLLIITSLCFVASIAILSLYLSSPKEKEMVLFSVIPYYVGLIIFTIFFIYVSPGLLDKLNGIMAHRFLIICVYLAFLFAYPIIYLLTAQQTSEDEQPDRTMLFLPFVILFATHLTIISPQVICQFKRLLEALALVLLISIFVLEMSKSDSKNDNTEFTILGLYIGTWVVLYLVFFLPEQPPKPK